MKYIIVLVLLVSSIYADRDGGPYIGLGLGTLTYDNDGLYTLPKQDTLDSETLYFGAYINKHLSVELNFADFGLVDDINNIEYFAVTVNTLAHYAFYEDVLDFYLKFGVGEMRERTADAKGFSYVLGLGTSIRFSEWLSVKIAYDRYLFGYDEDGDSSSDNDFIIHHIYTALEFQF